MIPDLCPFPPGISVSSLSDSLFVLHVQREDNKQKVPLGVWGGEEGTGPLSAGQGLTPVPVWAPRGTWCYRVTT